MSDYIESFNYLKDNLNRMMLYYFSEAFLDLPELGELKANIEDPSKENQIVLLTKDLSLKHDVNEYDYVNLLEKATLLQSNTFYLINLKETLNPNSFDFLINKYKETLEGLIKILEVINEINKPTNFKKNAILKKYLDLQQNFFNLHLQEINNKFFPPIFNWKLPKPTIPIQESKPRLKDLILKDNPEAIEKIIVNKFKDYNYTNINRMFVALDELGILKLEYGNRKELIECFNNSIGENMFDYEKVFKSKVDKIGDKHYKTIKGKIIRELGI